MLKSKTKMTPFWSTILLFLKELLKSITVHITVYLYIFRPFPAELIVFFNQRLYNYNCNIIVATIANITFQGYKILDLLNLLTFKGMGLH